MAEPAGLRRVRWLFPTLVVCPFCGHPGYNRCGSSAGGEIRHVRCGSCSGTWKLAALGYEAEHPDGSLGLHPVRRHQPHQP